MKFLTETLTKDQWFEINGKSCATLIHALEI